MTTGYTIEWGQQRCCVLVRDPGGVLQKRVGSPEEARGLVRMHGWPLAADHTREEGEHR
jgi:hypothetical protein